MAAEKSATYFHLCTKVFVVSFTFSILKLKQNLYWSILKVSLLFLEKHCQEMTSGFVLVFATATQQYKQYRNQEYFIYLFAHFESFPQI